MAQATQFKLDATKPFYALAGTADLSRLQADALAQPLRRKHAGDAAKM